MMAQQDASQQDASQQHASQQHASQHTSRRTAIRRAARRWTRRPTSTGIPRRCRRSTRRSRGSRPICSSSRSSRRRPTARPASSQGRSALITGGDSGIGRAVAVMYAREGADVAIVYLPDEQRDAEETQRHVEAEGRRCVLHPRRRHEPRVLRRGRRAHRARAREARHPRQQRRAPERQAVDRRDRATRVRAVPSAPTSTRTSTSRGPRCGTCRPVAASSTPGSDHRAGGREDPPRLLGDEGRDPRVHEVAGAEPRGAEDPRELRGAGPGVDAAQSAVQARGGGRASSGRTRP